MGVHMFGPFSSAALLDVLLRVPLVIVLQQAG